MLTVGEIARCCHVTPETVRYYVRAGLLHPARQPASGYKLFDEKDVSRLRFIKQAKLLGFTLAEIREIIRHSMMRVSPCPLVRSLIQQKVQSNRQKLDEMDALQRRMESAIAQWDSIQDGIPDSDSICRLIESFSLES